MYNINLLMVTRKAEPQLGGPSVNRYSKKSSCGRNSLLDCDRSVRLSS